MKPFFLLTFLIIFSCLKAQTSKGPENIIIITTDGFRWQEVFTGADTDLLRDKRFVQDTTLMQQLYGDSTPALRRQKLMPFFWNVIAQQGQLHGNRLYNNKVNAANFYKISYPGYNEILTGYADPKFIPNTPSPNRNTNILEYLNEEKAYHGKVVAFSSWNIFPYILNENRSGFMVNSGYENLTEDDSTDVMIDKVQDSTRNKTHTRYDLLTYLSAKEYIQEHHPRVVMIGMGETDEFAHQKKYDRYLQQANMFDKLVGELWYTIQTDPFYKDNTAFIITTDHGRGKKPTSWYAHNLFVKGSGETWMAMLGAGISAAGEIKTTNQFYQKQIAATVAMLLGQRFETDRPVAEALKLPYSAQGLEAKSSTNTFLLQNQVTAKEALK